MREGLGTVLPVDQRIVITANFGGQRVRRFVASGGEKKRQIPDKTHSEEFGRKFRHELTFLFLRARSLDRPSLLCNGDAQWLLHLRSSPLLRCTSGVST